MKDDVAEFEACRPTLLAHAYRMLGDMGRAEDIVQEAWLRWSGRDGSVDQPRRFLVKIVTNLCLNDLDSAKHRREYARGDRLPEPITLADTGLARVETWDQISMAFLVLLQRLTPAERAALLLHEVFDFDHAEVGELLNKSDEACRQLLRRARQHVASEKRAFRPSHEQHSEALRAFVQAASNGDASALMEILAPDVILVADAGPRDRTFGGARKIGAPVVGAAKVAAFTASVTPRGAGGLTTRECEINGQTALLVLREGEPFSAIVLTLEAGRIRSVFIHSDPAKLRRIR